MTLQRLTCDQFQNLLEQDPYLWTPEIRAHRASCSSCRIAHVLLLAEADQPKDLLVSSTPDHYFEELPARVVKQIYPVQSADWQQWLAPIAAVFLVTLGSLVLEPKIPFQNSQSNPSKTVSTEISTEALNNLASDSYDPDWFPTSSDLAQSDDISTFIDYFDSKEIEVLLTYLDSTDFDDSNRY